MPVQRRPPRQRRSRGTRFAALVVGIAMALTACTSATSGKIVAYSVPDAHLPDGKGITNSSFDTFAQNALSDIAQFWKTNYPKVSGGKALVPIKGGYYSVDGRQVAIDEEAHAPATENACIDQQNTAVVDNAFYCRDDDSVAWDRSPTHLLGRLASKYGRLLVGLIFAHEIGHSISNRLGVFDDDPPTIDTESQADCAAGAWAAAALKDQEPHFKDTTRASLDNALEGYLNARDDTPASSGEISHGNGFDRLSAIADGLDKGVTYCFSPNYFKTRTFTERPYYADEQNTDNLPVSSVLDTNAAKNVFVVDLNRFWKSAVAGSSGTKRWNAVTISSASHPPCADSAVQFGYCADTNKVYFNPTFARKAYYSLPTLSVDRENGDVTLSDNQPGDFALGVLFSIGWGMAVRHQTFGRSLSGEQALLSAVCYSGAYAKDVNIPPGGNGPQQITLSPADLDEAVSAMLDQVGQSDAFGARGTSGLDRIQAFVKGYKGGLGVC